MLILAWLYLIWEGDTGRARSVVEEASSRVAPQTLALELELQGLTTYIDGRFRDAYRGITLDVAGIDSVSYYFAKGDLAERRHDSALTRTYYDSARTVLEGRVRSWPENPFYHSDLGIAYSVLGIRDRAITEASTAVEMVPISKDAVEGTIRREYLALVYRMVGESEKALDELEFLLSVPSWVSPALLRIDPFWDPIRGHPRFQRLLERYEN